MNHQSDAARNVRRARDLEKLIADAVSKPTPTRHKAEDAADRLALSQLAWGRAAVRVIQWLMSKESL